MPANNVEHQQQLENNTSNNNNNNNLPTSALTSSRSGRTMIDIPPLPPPGGDEGGDASPFVQSGVARKNLQPVGVTYLDGNSHAFYVHKNATGEVLFELVCAQLGLNEKDYFGLFFYDEQATRHTLYKDKTIVKQIKVLPWRFFFEVKFYPPQPAQLTEDLTRYLLCLQLRQDVFEERLPTSFAVQAKLGALAAQAQFGDYQPTDAYMQFLRGAKFAQVVTEPLLEKIVDLHKQYRGLTVSEAELAYLNECKDLAMYGVILHPAKDSKGKPAQIGVSAHGIGVYNDQMRVHRFAWPNIIKFSYRRNVFSVKLKPGELEKKDTTVAYKLTDYPAAKRLWKCAVEHHTFFRLIQPESKPKSSLLRFGSSRFRYYGRTNFQTQMASQLFDGQGASSSARVTSKSVEDIANRGHETQQQAHDAGATSRDLAGSPVKSGTVVYETSTFRRSHVSEDGKKVGGQYSVYADEAGNTALASTSTAAMPPTVAAAFTAVTGHLTTISTLTTTNTRLSSGYELANDSLLIHTYNTYTGGTFTSSDNNSLNRDEFMSYRNHPSPFSTHYAPLSMSTMSTYYGGDSYSTPRSSYYQPYLNDSGYYASTSSPDADLTYSIGAYSPMSRNEMGLAESTITDIFTTPLYITPMPSASKPEELSPYESELPMTSSSEKSGKVKMRVTVSDRLSQMRSNLDKMGGECWTINKYPEMPLIPLKSVVTVYHCGWYNKAIQKDTNLLGDTKAFAKLHSHTPKKRIPTCERFLRSKEIIMRDKEYVQRNNEITTYPLKYFVKTYHSGFSTDPQKYSYRHNTTVEEIRAKVKREDYKTEIAQIDHERLEKTDDIETLAIEYYVKHRRTLKTDHNYKKYYRKRRHERDESPATPIDSGVRPKHKIIIKTGRPIRITRRTSLEKEKSRKSVADEELCIKAEEIGSHATVEKEKSPIKEKQEAVTGTMREYDSTQQDRESATNAEIDLPKSPKKVTDSRKLRAILTLKKRNKQHSYSPAEMEQLFGKYPKENLPQEENLLLQPSKNDFQSGNETSGRYFVPEMGPTDEAKNAEFEEYVQRAPQQPSESTQQTLGKHKAVITLKRHSLDVENRQKCEQTSRGLIEAIAPTDDSAQRGGIAIKSGKESVSKKLKAVIKLSPIRSERSVDKTGKLDDTIPIIDTGTGSLIKTTSVKPMESEYEEAQLKLGTEGTTKDTIQKDNTHEDSKKRIILTWRKHSAGGESSKLEKRKSPKEWEEKVEINKEIGAIAEAGGERTEAKLKDIESSVQQLTHPRKMKGLLTLKPVSKIQAKEKKALTMQPTPTPISETATTSTSRESDMEKISLHKRVAINPELKTERELRTVRGTIAVVEEDKPTDKVLSRDIEPSVQQLTRPKKMKAVLALKPLSKVEAKEKRTLTAQPTPTPISETATTSTSRDMEKISLHKPVEINPELKTQRELKTVSEDIALEGETEKIATKDLGVQAVRKKKALLKLKQPKVPHNDSDKITTEFAWKISKDKFQSPEQKRPETSEEVFTSGQLGEHLEKTSDFVGEQPKETEKRARKKIALLRLKHIKGENEHDVQPTSTDKSNDLQAESAEITQCEKRKKKSAITSKLKRKMESENLMAKQLEDAGEVKIAARKKRALLTIKSMGIIKSEDITLKSEKYTGSLNNTVRAQEIITCPLNDYVQISKSEKSDDGVDSAKREAKITTKDEKPRLEHPEIIPVNAEIAETNKQGSEEEPKIDRSQKKRAIISWRQPKTPEEYEEGQIEASTMKTPTSSDAPKTIEQRKSLEKSQAILILNISEEKEIYLPPVIREIHKAKPGEELPLTEPIQIPSMAEPIAPEESIPAVKQKQRAILTLRTNYKQDWRGISGPSSSGYQRVEMPKIPEIHVERPSISTATKRIRDSRKKLRKLRGGKASKKQAAVLILKPPRLEEKMKERKQIKFAKLAQGEPNKGMPQKKRAIISWRKPKTPEEYKERQIEASTMKILVSPVESRAIEQRKSLERSDAGEIPHICGTDKPEPIISKEIPSRKKRTAIIKLKQPRAEIAVSIESSEVTREKAIENKSDRKQKATLRPMKDVQAEQAKPFPETTHEINRSKDVETMPLYNAPDIKVFEGTSERKKRSNDPLPKKRTAILTMRLPISIRKTSDHDHKMSAQEGSSDKSNDNRPPMEKSRFVSEIIPLKKRKAVLILKPTLQDKPVLEEKSASEDGEKIIRPADESTTYENKQNVIMEPRKPSEVKAESVNLLASSDPARSMNQKSKAILTLKQSGLSKHPESENETTLLNKESRIGLIYDIHRSSEMDKLPMTCKIQQSDNFPIADERKTSSAKASNSMKSQPETTTKAMNSRKPKAIITWSKSKALEDLPAQLVKKPIGGKRDSQINVNATPGTEHSCNELNRNAEAESIPLSEVVTKPYESASIPKGVKPRKQKAVLRLKRLNDQTEIIASSSSQTTKTSRKKEDKKKRGSVKKCKAVLVLTDSNPLSEKNSEGQLVPERDELKADIIIDENDQEESPVEKEKQKIEKRKPSGFNDDKRQMTKKKAVLTLKYPEISVRPKESSSFIEHEEWKQSKETFGTSIQILPGEMRQTKKTKDVDNWEKDPSQISTKGKKVTPKKKRAILTLKQHSALKSALRNETNIPYETLNRTSRSAEMESVPFSAAVQAAEGCKEVKQETKKRAFITLKSQPVSAVSEKSSEHANEMETEELQSSDGIKSREMIVQRKQKAALILKTPTEENKEAREEARGICTFTGPINETKHANELEQSPLSQHVEIIPQNASVKLEEAKQAKMRAVIKLKHSSTTKPIAEVRPMVRKVASDESLHGTSEKSETVMEDTIIASEEPKLIEEMKDIFAVEKSDEQAAAAFKKTAIITLRKHTSTDGKYNLNEQQRIHLKGKFSDELSMAKTELSMYKPEEDILVHNTSRIGELESVPIDSYVETYESKPQNDDIKEPKKKAILRLKQPAQLQSATATKSIVKVEESDKKLEIENISHILPRDFNEKINTENVNITEKIAPRKKKAIITLRSAIPTPQLVITAPSIEKVDEADDNIKMRKLAVGKSETSESKRRAHKRQKQQYLKVKPYHKRPKRVREKSKGTDETKQIEATVKDSGGPIGDIGETKPASDIESQPLSAYVIAIQNEPKRLESTKPKMNKQKIKKTAIITTRIPAITEDKPLAQLNDYASEFASGPIGETKPTNDMEHRPFSDYIRRAQNEPNYYKSVKPDLKAEKKKQRAIIILRSPTILFTQAPGQANIVNKVSTTAEKEIMVTPIISEFKRISDIERQPLSDQVHITQKHHGYFESWKPNLKKQVKKKAIITLQKPTEAEAKTKGEENAPGKSSSIASNQITLPVGETKPTNDVEILPIPDYVHIAHNEPNYFESVKADLKAEKKKQQAIITLRKSIALTTKEEPALSESRDVTAKKFAESVREINPASDIEKQPLSDYVDDVTDKTKSCGSAKPDLVKHKVKGRAIITLQKSPRHNVEEETMSKTGEVAVKELTTRPVCETNLTNDMEEKPLSEYTRIFQGQPKYSESIKSDIKAPKMKKKAIIALQKESKIEEKPAIQAIAIVDKEFTGPIIDTKPTRDIDREPLSNYIRISQYEPNYFESLKPVLKEKKPKKQAIIILQKSVIIKAERGDEDVIATKYKQFAGPISETKPTSDVKNLPLSDYIHEAQCDIKQLDISRSVTKVETKKKAIITLRTTTLRSSEGKTTTEMRSDGVKGFTGPIGETPRTNDLEKQPLSDYIHTKHNEPDYYDNAKPESISHKMKKKAILTLQKSARIEIEEKSVIQMGAVTIKGPIDETKPADNIEQNPFSEFIHIPHDDPSYFESAKSGSGVKESKKIAILTTQKSTVFKLEKPVKAKIATVEAKSVCDIEKHSLSEQVHIIKDKSHYVEGAEPDIKAKKSKKRAIITLQKLKMPIIEAKKEEPQPQTSEKLSDAKELPGTIAETKRANDLENMPLSHYVSAVQNELTPYGIPKSAIRKQQKKKALITLQKITQPVSEEEKAVTEFSELTGPIDEIQQTSDMERRRLADYVHLSHDDPSYFESVKQELQLRKKNVVLTLKKSMGTKTGEKSVAPVGGLTTKEFKGQISETKRTNDMENLPLSEYIQITEDQSEQIKPNVKMQKIKKKAIIILQKSTSPQVESEEKTNSVTEELTKPIRETKPMHIEMQPPPEHMHLIQDKPERFESSKSDSNKRKMKGKAILTLRKSRILKGEEKVATSLAKKQLISSIDETKLTSDIEQQTLSSGVVQNDPKRSESSESNMNKQKLKKTAIITAQKPDVPHGYKEPVQSDKFINKEFATPMEETKLTSDIENHALSDYVNIAQNESKYFESSKPDVNKQMTKKVAVITLQKSTALFTEIRHITQLSGSVSKKITGPIDETKPTNEMENLPFFGYIHHEPSYFELSREALKTDKRKQKAIITLQKSAGQKVDEEAVNKTEFAAKVQMTAGPIYETKPTGDMKKEPLLAYTHISQGQPKYSESINLEVKAPKMKKRAIITLQKKSKIEKMPATQKSPVVHKEYTGPETKPTRDIDREPLSDYIHISQYAPNYFESLKPALKAHKSKGKAIIILQKPIEHEIDEKASAQSSGSAARETTGPIGETKPTYEMENLPFSDHIHIAHSEPNYFESVRADLKPEKRKQQAIITLRKSTALTTKEEPALSESRDVTAEELVGSVLEIHPASDIEKQPLSDYVDDVTDKTKSCGSAKPDLVKLVKGRAIITLQKSTAPFTEIKQITQLSGSVSKEITGPIDETKPMSEMENLPFSDYIHHEPSSFELSREALKPESEKRRQKAIITLKKSTALRTEEKAVAKGRPDAEPSPELFGSAKPDFKEEKTKEKAIITSRKRSAPSIEGAVAENATEVITEVPIRDTEPTSDIEKQPISNYVHICQDDPNYFESYKSGLRTEKMKQMAIITWKQSNILTSERSRRRTNELAVKSEPEILQESIRPFSAVSKHTAPIDEHLDSGRTTEQPEGLGQKKKMKALLKWKKPMIVEAKSSRPLTSEKQNIARIIETDVSLLARKSISETCSILQDVDIVSKPVAVLYLKERGKWVNEDYNSYTGDTLPLRFGLFSRAKKGQTRKNSAEFNNIAHISGFQHSECTLQSYTNEFTGTNCVVHVNLIRRASYDFMCTAFLAHRTRHFASISQRDGPVILPKSLFSDSISKSNVFSFPARPKNGAGGREELTRGPRTHHDRPKEMDEEKEEKEEEEEESENEGTQREYSQNSPQNIRADINNQSSAQAVTSRRNNKWKNKLFSPMELKERKKNGDSGKKMKSAENRRKRQGKSGVECASASVEVRIENGEQNCRSGCRIRLPTLASQTGQQQQPHGKAHYQLNALRRDGAEFYECSHLPTSTDTFEGGRVTYAIVALQGPLEDDPTIDPSSIPSGSCPQVSVVMRPREADPNAEAAATIPRSRSSFLQSLLHKLAQKKSKSVDKLSKKSKKATPKASGVDVSSGSSSSSSSDAEEVVEQPPPTQTGPSDDDERTSRSYTALSSRASAGPYVLAPVDGRVIREETVEQVYRIRGGAGERIPHVDPDNASLSGVVSQCVAETTTAPKVTYVEERHVVRDHGPVPDLIIKEASLPHSTVHTWHETSAGPETVTTEVDEHGNVVKRTVVKSEQVKHTVRTQSYQTFTVDENTASGSQQHPQSEVRQESPTKAPRPTPPKRTSAGPTTTVAQHTIAYENGAPVDVTNTRLANGNGVGTGNGFSDEDLVSTKAVTTGNRTVETLTYKRERDGAIETHVEHRITIHGGDDVDHDAELSRAILDATNMNPEMTVEKVEVRQESATN